MVSVGYAKSKFSPHVTEMIRVRPMCIVVYRKYALGGHQIPLKTNISTKVIPRHAKAKIRDRMALWREIAKQAARPIIMITLTMSGRQKHSDTDIKRHMLNRFLIHMKRKGCREYLWKAERQVNGNIHFHIITDKCIHMDEIRIQWLRCLKSYGYKADLRNIHKYPCTDVRKVDDNVCKYLMKYVSKDNLSLIDGRLWYMTRHLSSLKYPEIKTMSNILKDDEHVRVISIKDAQTIIKEHSCDINWTLYYRDYSSMIYGNSVKEVI